METFVAYRLTDGRQRFEGRSRNISMTGLLMSPEAPLEVGQELEVTFGLPNRPDDQPIKAMARVVRTGIGSGKDVALDFINVIMGDDRIEDYIKRMM